VFNDELVWQNENALVLAGKTVECQSLTHKWSDYCSRYEITATENTEPVEADDNAPVEPLDDRYRIFDTFAEADQHFADGPRSGLNRGPASLSGSWLPRGIRLR